MQVFRNMSCSSCFTQVSVVGHAWGLHCSSSHMRAVCARVQVLQLLWLKWLKPVQLLGPMTEHNSMQTHAKEVADIWRRHTQALHAESRVLTRAEGQRCHLTPLFPGGVQKTDSGPQRMTWRESFRFSEPAEDAYTRPQGAAGSASSDMQESTYQSARGSGSPPARSRSPRRRNQASKRRPVASSAAGCEPAQSPAPVEEIPLHVQVERLRAQGQLAEPQPYFKPEAIAYAQMPFDSIPLRPPEQKNMGCASRNCQFLASEAEVGGSWCCTKCWYIEEIRDGQKMRKKPHCEDCGRRELKGAPKITGELFRPKIGDHWTTEGRLYLSLVKAWDD